MRKFTIGTGIDVDFGATQPASVFDMQPNAAAPVDFPFLQGNTVIAVIGVSAWAEAEQVGASLALQSSADNNTYATMTDVDGNSVLAGGLAASPVCMYEIVVPAYLRLRNLSVTAGDGRGFCYLLQN